MVGATLNFEPLVPKFEAFGWAALEINGHDLNAVFGALDQARQTKGRPTAIVARTIKGYPIQGLLSSDPNHHGKPLTRDEAQKALALLA